MVQQFRSIFTLKFSPFFQGPKEPLDITDIQVSMYFRQVVTLLQEPPNSNMHTYLFYHQ